MKTKLTTTQKGYGRVHQQERKMLIRLLRDGDACAQCREGWPGHPPRYHPMYRAYAAKLDLSHTADRTATIGLSYSRCNRSEAASRGNRMRKPVTRYSRIW